MTVVQPQREAWAFKESVWHGPFATWRAAWDYLGSLPGEDGLVLGPTDPAFCEAWIGEREKRTPNTSLAQ